MIERRIPRYLNFVITIPDGMIDLIRRFNDASPGNRPSKSISMQFSISESQLKRPIGARTKTNKNYNPHNGFPLGVQIRTSISRGGVRSHVRVTKR